MKLPNSGRALALGLALTLAACSGGPKAGPALPPPPPVATSVLEIDSIAALLNEGEVDAARKRIAAAQKRDPANASLRLLRDSIDGDAKILLGPDNFAYTAKLGDTIIGLAERFLGNRLKAYQLARYNGIANPSALVAGQVLKMPAEKPRSEASRRPDTVPSAAAKPKPKPAAAAAKPVPPKAPVANPAAARQARAAGLAALNQGNLARAVGLLGRANALDPGNPVIVRDLARAQRIAATVKARR